MKNRNLIRARVPMAPDVYASLLETADQGALMDDVLASMNRLASERNRRVFGTPWQTEATEVDGIVWLDFEAFTEPA